MGCRVSKFQEADPLPIFNLTVLGFEDSGKTAIMNHLKGDIEHICNEELGIFSFILNDLCKLIAFEVAGKAHKTWSNYLATSHIVLFVVDINDTDKFQKISEALQKIDRQLDDNAKIVVAFNKVDSLKENSKFNGEPQATLDSCLSFSELKHEIFTCKCSAKNNTGIVELMKKIYSICKNYYKPSEIL